MMDNRQKQEEAVDLARKIMDQFLDEDTAYNSNIPEQAEKLGIPAYAAAAHRAYANLSYALYTAQMVLALGNGNVDEETGEAVEILMRTALEAPAAHSTSIAK